MLINRSLSAEHGNIILSIYTCLSNLDVCEVQSKKLRIREDKKNNLASNAEDFLA